MTQVNPALLSDIGLPPNDRLLVARDAVLASRHGMRRRAALRRAPAPEIRVRRLAGLDLLDDVLDPLLIPGDVAPAYEDLVGSLRHLDDPRQIDEVELVAIGPVEPRIDRLDPLAALGRARRAERVEVASVVATEAEELEPCVPPKRRRVVLQRVGGRRIASDHEGARPRPPGA